MDKPLVVIIYKLADGKRIRLEVTSEVAELLEQSDRQIRSQRRQDRRHLENEEYEDGAIDTTSQYPHEDFADLLIRIDSYKLLYAAMKKLSDVQRRRLVMYFFHEMTYRQIAEKEGVGFKTVARSVERAIEKIRRLLIL